MAVGFGLLVVLGLTTPFCMGGNVTYDHRALVIDGKRRVLVSGSIHYPRSTPQMWPDLIQKSKDGGLDVIETYVFWNLHEPVQGQGFWQYDFEGNKDLVKFMKLVNDAGLFAHLRIGPYVCAEWNYGGFPLWLHSIPGIVLRTDNEPFKAEMQRFTAKIVDMMKQENLYASQGGPIILSQIENEYGNIQKSYGDSAKTYINWAATMATSLNTGVPWVMCQQKDAPDPIVGYAIDTCNGFYCDQYVPNSNKPKMWTENWTGWFGSFGEAVPFRPVEDIAFAVARFYQLGGTFQNYYMYHGGTNFGRTTGGPFIITSYDYDAPIDEYGLLNQPKWGHLKDLHKAIKLCEEAMVATDPKTTSLGSNLEATVYKTDSGQCAAFLANWGTQSDTTVKFNGKSYNLPAWSVSILPDCTNVALNTAKINSASTIANFVRQPSKDVTATDVSLSGWSWINEPVGISSDIAFTKPGLLEQLNTTADQSDYLWYSLSFEMKEVEPFLNDGSQTVLHVDSLGHGLYVFINGQLAGSVKGRYSNPKVSIDVPVTLQPGTNKIDLLSLTVGLQNYGAFFDKTGAGVTGPVQLKGSGQNGSNFDLSSQQWTYQVGLKGEDFGLSTGSSSLWVSQPTLPNNQPLVWYKTTFDAPSGNSPVALDFKGMGKGQAWINGQSIGRYWPTTIAPNSGCADPCDYRGPFNSKKCLKNCGKPTQQLYHVPRSWLKPSGNILVLFEESGGDPTKLSFATRETESICSRISESHPLPVDMWTSSDEETRKTSGPTLSLGCPRVDQVISKIKFASFGTPRGTCGSFSHGRCRSKRARSIVEQACIGSRNCEIGVSVNTFGDPCAGIAKSLAVEASCA
ncbi:beta-galactosidase 8 [Phtheirospermum japonicum]|uniref:Beta-galactosidase n=1 Tax=Phtheirospermum japonicum TaxID=374723 RepID=A0A830DAF3_9LAMI|nr:beta-galactosidase 8 [Phtheirospermum japonicum]